MELDDDFDYSAGAGSLAEIMDRAMDAMEVEHDQLDLDHEERQAVQDVLRQLDQGTWPLRG